MQKKYLTAMIVICAVLLVLLAGSGRSVPPQVVTTTSVLSSVAEDIAGGMIRAVSLVPAGSCPGHFDVKVQHLRLIEDSGMLLAHGFESYLPDLQRAVGTSSFAPTLIRLDGNWLTHAGIASLYGQVGEQLMERFPDDRDVISRGQERALSIAEEQHQKVQSLAARRGLAGRRLLCNDHLRGYLEYLGFDVTATYGRREDLSPGEIHDILRIGSKKGVELVVDNMQAGADTGRVFAEELDVPHVAVSNFPGVLPGADTLAATLLANARLIADALEPDGTP